MIRFVRSALGRLSSLNAALTRWGCTAAGALLAVMLLVALAQILARELFGHTLDWAEELARMALVWCVFLVAPYAYRAGAYVAIEVFAEALPRRLLLAVALFVNMLILWICAALLIESAAFVQRGMTIVASSLGFPMAFVYAIVPASLTAMLLTAVEHLLRLCAGAAASESREDALRLAGLVPLPPDLPDGKP